MITIRKSAERRQTICGTHRSSTNNDEHEPSSSCASTRVVARLDEIELAPGAVSAPHIPRGAEVVTYVRRGTLSQRYAAGRSNTIRAGEFQRMRVDRTTRCKETNAGLSDFTHVFRITLRSAKLVADGHAATREQRLFASALRRNALCVVASKDGRGGSLQLEENALILSSALDPGHHLVYEFLPGRSVWVHVAAGSVKIFDLMLSDGDSAVVTSDPYVSINAVEPAEILLIDTHLG